MTSSRFLVVEGRAGVQLRQEARPEPARAQVRVRTSVSLVSPGTELHYIDRCQREDTTLRLGYCVAGVVDALGEGVEGLALGTPVIAMGWEHATHAEYVCVPKRLCVAVPGGLAPWHAVFAGIAATALHGLHRARLGASDRALVVGGGLVGQLVARLAERVCAHVCVADVLAPRLVGLGEGVAVVEVDRTRGLHASLEAKAQAQGQSAPSFTHVLACVPAADDALLRDCLALLGPHYHHQTARTVLTVLGRMTVQVPFGVELGNVDIRMSARCGAGYRDPAYVHGEVDYAAPVGEGTVDENLARCARMIAEGTLDVAGIPVWRVPFVESASVYPELRRRPEYVAAVFEYGEPHARA